MRNNFSRISYGHSAQESLYLELLGSSPAALQGYGFMVEGTVIQKGNESPLVTRILNGKVNTPTLGTHSPKVIWCFPLLLRSLLATEFTSHSLRYLQKMFLLLTLDLKREYRGKICLEQLYYRPLNESGRQETRQKRIM